MDKKKLILITSPPACGKTYVAKNLAKALNNCVYLDKDDLIVLSRKIFEVANEPFDRSSDFFHEWIRDAEYDAIMEIGLDALNYNDTIILNAPFKKEIRDQEWISNLRKKLASKNADMICANSLTQPGAGYQVDTNIITLITADDMEELPLLSKEEAADRILDKILIRKQ